jgi:predicted lipoprotein with Yx(FWY)xxD motif
MPHLRVNAGRQHDADGGRFRRSGAALIAGLAVVAGVAAAALSGLAAAEPPPTHPPPTNPKIGKKIVVDAHGLTVYVLSPETVHNRLCTSANRCFGFWPPVTVASAKSKLTKASGVKGKLAIVHQFGVFQVTLDGHPLYRFKLDANKRASAKGDKIQGFNGTWHVVVGASSKSKTTTTSTTTTTTTSTTTSTRSYPGY